MRSIPTRVVDDTTPDDPDEFTTLLDSWRRHLRAQRISPATVSTYSIAVGQLRAFLLERGMPIAWVGVS